MFTNRAQRRRWSSRLLSQCCYLAEPLERRMLLAVTITATKQDVLLTDVDGDTRFDPGDTIQYNVVIANSGDTDATAVMFADLMDAQTTLGTVRVSPLAARDTFNAVGNTPRSIAAGAGLRTNDIDIDGLTPQGSLLVTAGTFPTSAGGSVLIAADGSFTYSPQLGDQNLTDTFTYTITDGDGLASTGTCTINLGPRVWYVDSAAAPGGNGYFTTPYNSLAAVTGAAGSDAAGDIIFVNTGVGNYTGGITLLNNQTLWGRNEALVVNTITVFAAGTDPVIENATAGGNGVTLAGGNTLKGFTVGNTSGFDIANTAATSVGTLTITNVVLNGTGGLFRADAAGTLAVTFDSATTTSASGNGIHLGAGTTGNFTVTAGAVSGVAGIDVLSTASTATVSIGASITSNAGGSIEVTVRSANNVTFSGALSITGGTGLNIHDNTGGTVAFTNASKVINTGAGTAVNLANNPGATINFTGGGLDIDTTTGTAFTAAGGGTISVTGTGNSINSMSATALNVTSTTIGAGGLLFHDVSAGNNTAAADPATGIVLNNTGPTAGLTIAGDGNASLGGNDSGGIIQFTTNYGISLTNTLNPSLTNMNIHDIARNGIDGFDVTNFTFVNGKITTTGTASIAGDFETSAIAFVDRSGANDNTIEGIVTITGNLISEPERNGVMIETWAGTISNVNISNNTLSGGTTNARIQDAVHVFAQGTTGGITTGAISNNTISDFSFFDTAPVIDVFIGGNGIRLVSDTNTVNTSSTLGTSGNAFVISGNDIDNVGSNLIAVSALGRTASANVRILDNGTVADPMTNAEGLGISLFFGGNGTFNGLIHNNVIDNIDQDPNPAGSSGIGVQSDFGGNTGANTDVTNSNFTVSNNRISDIAGNGILATGINNAGTMNVRINDNNVTTPPTLQARYGIRVQQSNVGTQPTINLEMHGNTTAGAFNIFQTPGVDPPGNGIGIRKQDPNTFRIEGLTPTPTNDPTAYINAQNPSGHGTDKIAGTGFVAGNVPDSPVPLLFLPRGEVAITPPTIEPPIAVPRMTPPPIVATEPAAVLPPVIVNDGILSQADLHSFVGAAIKRWSATGLTRAQLDLIKSVTFDIADLPGWYLGSAAPGHITLDTDAAGNGWFIDATPLDDREFGTRAGERRLYTSPTGAAAGKLDLLTTLMHEMGHQLGLEDSYQPLERNSLMYGYLTLGERRLPARGQAIGADPHAHDDEIGPDFLFTPINVGTLTFGTTIRVRFTAQIANPLVGVGSVSNQGTVSGSNFTSVNTNDPDTPAANDPTVTVVQPATPSAPDLQAASDTGSLNTDNLTNAANPVFDASGVDAAATVELLRGGVVVATRTGPGALTDTGAPAGSNTYTLRQRFGAGGINSDTSANLVVEIDRTISTPGAPDLAAASDAGAFPDDNITNVNNPTFNTTTGIDAGATVELLRDGTSVASRTGAGTLTQPAVADGTYSYTLRQSDLAGNTASSPGINVKIDTVAPTLTATPTFQFETGHSILYPFSELMNQSFLLSTIAVQNLETLAFVPDANKTLTFLNTDVTLRFNSPLADGNYRATITTSLRDVAGNAFAGNVLDFFVLAADANRDRKVDVADLGILASNWQLTGRTFSQGNFNYSANGLVDVDDLGILSSSWQKQLPAPSAPFAGSAPSPAERPSRRGDRLIDQIEL